MADASYDKNWAPELLAAGITPDADPLDLKALLRQIIAKVGTAGNTTVRKFAFAFNSPGILTGHTLYTPTIGDILLDAWVEIDTAWNGTTPWGDLGQFNGANTGWFHQAAVPSGGTNPAIPMEAASATNLAGSPNVARLAGLFSLASAGLAAAISEGGLTVASPLLTFPSSSLLLGNPIVPAKFTAADPIKFCVSQDGTNTGADPGSAEGAAILFLVTATPV